MKQLHGEHSLKSNPCYFLWENGNIIELLNEGESIQERLPTGERSKDIAKISIKFKELMQKGNVSGALKLLTNQMSNDILPLTEETLSQIKSLIILN